MMQKFEYWGHLLYPKSNFDDLLAKVEQLGKKRAVKVRKLICLFLHLY
jgi:hypothetical protein